MSKFREWLENKELGEYKLNESSEISSEIYAKVYKLAKEIVKNDEKYKEEARKLNTWFKKETGKANGILSQYTENDMMISDRDLKWLEDNSK